MKNRIMGMVGVVVAIVIFYVQAYRDKNSWEAKHRALAKQVQMANERLMRAEALVTASKLALQVTETYLQDVAKQDEAIIKALDALQPKVVDTVYTNAVKTNGGWHGFDAQSGAKVYFKSNYFVPWTNSISSHFEPRVKEEAP